LSLRPRITILGVAAGAIAAIAALRLGATLGNTVGGILGLLAGALAGGIGTTLGANSLVKQLERQLASLGAGGQCPGWQPMSSTGWAELDSHIASHQQALEEYQQTRTDFEEVEHLARVLWHTGADADSAPPADARSAVLGLLGEVRQVADRVVEDARALDQATDQIASGAVDQSQTVTRTTTVVEGLSDNIDRISHNAEAAAQAGHRTRHEVHRGLEQVHGLIEGIDRLRAHVESNGRKVRRLGNRSVEIGAIVDLIDGISGRTDMLALNATIESVRAGEHGRGFAVVADEIRKLAERTASATREIGTLVEAIQADTHESIAALGQEQAEVEQEAQRVREAGAALERISEVAEESARLVEGISHSATDQVQATHELVRAMQRISEVTRQAQAGAGRAREHVRLLAQRCDRLLRLSGVPIEATGRTKTETDRNRNGHEHGHINANGASPRRPLPYEPPS
jgi:chromosome segregation ATPase